MRYFLIFICGVLVVIILIALIAPIVNEMSCYLYSITGGNLNYTYDELTNTCQVYYPNLGWTIIE